MRKSCDDSKEDNICEGNMPSITPELYRLITCFTLCESQVKVGSTGYVYGFDFNVIIKVAEDMGIIRNEHFYRYLRVFENVFIKERNNEIERRNKSNDNRRTLGLR